MNITTYISSAGDLEAPDVGLTVFPDQPEERTDRRAGPELHGRVHRDPVPAQVRFHVIRHRQVLPL